MLHKQDSERPELKNLYGHALFQIAARLKQSPKPMTVEHLWEIAEVVRLCDASAMRGFEKVLGKTYWRAFRRILDDLHGGTEIRMSGVSCIALGWVGLSGAELMVR